MIEHPRLKEEAEERYLYDRGTGQVARRKDKSLVKPGPRGYYLYLGNSTIQAERVIWLLLKGELPAQGEIRFRDGDWLNLRESNLFRIKESAGLGLAALNAIRAGEVK